MSLQDLEAKKDVANQLVREQKYAEAVTIYGTVMTALMTKISPKDDNEDSVFDDATLLYIACLNNTSMALLKLEKFSECIDICTRAVNLDDTNLKALYRRAQSYKFLALETPFGSDEEKALWNKSSADIVSILMKESQNKQALELKAEVRKLKFDKETAYKYNMSYGESHKSIGADEKKDVEYKGSTFKGFPPEEQVRKAPVGNKLQEDGEGQYISNVSEEEMDKFRQKQLEIAQKHQQVLSEQLKEGMAWKDKNAKDLASLQEALKNNVFLDPTWTPAEAGSSAGLAEESLPAATGAGKPQRPSFRNLLGKAKEINQAIKDKAGAWPAQEKAKKVLQKENKIKKQIALSDGVDSALSELLRSESQQHEKYLHTLVQKKAVAITREKGSKDVKKRLNATLKPVPSHNDKSKGATAWETLVNEEESQKQLVDARLKLRKSRAKAQEERKAHKTRKEKETDEYSD